MSTNITPLNNEVHANLKVKNTLDISLLDGQQIVPLVVHEFALASTNYPIVFVKNAETGQFQVVSLMGFKPGENLFVQNGEWVSTHVPGAVGNYPFKLIAHESDPNQVMLGIDHSSDLVSEDEGEALFDADGKETEYLTRRKDASIQYLESGHVTDAFTAQLAEYDLLAARNLSLNFAGEEINMDGMYVIDEQKLNELPDDKFLNLKKRGFLVLIYATMVSMHQIQRLAKLRMDQA